MKTCVARKTTSFVSFLLPILLLLCAVGHELFLTTTTCVLELVLGQCACQTDPTVGDDGLECVSARCPRCGHIVVVLPTGPVSIDGERRPASGRRSFAPSCEHCTLALAHSLCSDTSSVHVARANQTRFYRQGHATTGSSRWSRTPAISRYRSMQLSARCRRRDAHLHDDRARREKSIVVQCGLTEHAATFLKANHHLSFSSSVPSTSIGRKLSKAAKKRNITKTEKIQVFW